jgi:type II secretory pathway component PulF
MSPSILKRKSADAPGGGSIGGGSVGSASSREDGSRPRVVPGQSALVDEKAKLRKKESLHLLIQLKSMLEAGVPMLASLRTLIQHAESARQERILAKITTIIEGGNDLSFALACLPRCFESYVVHLLAAGERAGALDESLGRAIELMNKQMHLRGKIIGALAYPAFLLFFTATITTGILLFLVPKFEGMLMAKPDLLPTSTKIVLAASQFLRVSPGLAGGIAAGVILSLILALRNRKAQSIAFGALSHLPAVGTLIHKAYVARSVTTLALTLESGVPILTGLKHAEDVSSLPKLQAMWRRAREVVREGRPLFTAMEGSDIPPALKQMMIAGESSGSLDESLRTAANFLDRETDAALKTFTGLLGPMTVCIAGLVVGFVVVALMTPILQLSKFIG